MESLLEMESHVQHGKGFAPVLLSQDFVLSLITCALEIVIVSLKLVGRLLSRHRRSHSRTVLASPGALGVSDPSEHPQTETLRILQDHRRLPERHDGHASQNEKTSATYRRTHHRIVGLVAWLIDLHAHSGNALRDRDAQNGRDSITGAFLQAFCSVDPRPLAGSEIARFRFQSRGLLDQDRQEISNLWHCPAALSAGSTSESTQSSSLSASRESHLPEGLGTIESVHAKPNRSRIVLEDFFRKTLRLAAHRLMDFKLHLNFQPVSNNAIMLQV